MVERGEAAARRFIERIIAGGADRHAASPATAMRGVAHALARDGGVIASALVFAARQDWIADGPRAGTSLRTSTGPRI